MDSIILQGTEHTLNAIIWPWVQSREEWAHIKAVEAEMTPWASFPVASRETNCFLLHTLESSVLEALMDFNFTREERVGISLI